MSRNNIKVVRENSEFPFISLRFDSCGSAGSGSELSTVVPEMHGKTTRNRSGRHCSLRNCGGIVAEVSKRFRKRMKNL